MRSPRRDFHPLNIPVADDGAPAVLDWSNATVGDRYHDVARTLVPFCGPIAARSGAERSFVSAAASWPRYPNVYGSCPSTRLGSATGRRCRPSTDGASSPT
jgi:hypothetical protein